MTHDIDSGPDPIDSGTIEAPVIDFRLYVAGSSPRSIRAIANLNRVCAQHLTGRYRIEVIDLLEHPELASINEIIAIPTLIRNLPEPVQRIIGDLSDTERILVDLQILPEPAHG